MADQNQTTMTTEKNFEIGEYRDEIHAETLDDLQHGEYGYKYRLPDGVMMPPYITPERYRVSRTLETRLGDICYTSYPKSGSTWLAYILVLLVNDGETPDNSTLRNCLHWVASSWTYPRDGKELTGLPSPRIFKSHMPYAMALGGDPAGSPCRYLYIARNPKDVAVSYYFFEREKSWSGNYSGPWEHWLRLFAEGRVQRGDWFDHVLGWWSSRHLENVLFLKYEDLCRDFPGEITKVARFLDRPIARDALERIQDMTSFRAMSRTDFSNMHEIQEFTGFFREGRIGSWKDQFTPAQSESFDGMCARRLAGSGLEFDFE